MTSFNALSGVELQAFVAYQVEKAMRDSGEFTPNVSFPWFTFKFSLNIQALSGVPGDTRVGEGGTTRVGVEGGQGELPPASEGVPLAVMEFSGEREISVPDEARIEVGLPIMEQVMEHGINVDKPRLVVKKGKPTTPAVAPWKEEEDGK